MTVLLIGLSSVLVGRQTQERGEQRARLEISKYWGELARHGELEAGDQAPVFELADAEGVNETCLKSLHGSKPLVLVFGSYTCPYFRDSARVVKDLYDSYKNDAQILLVYIREAHPQENGQLPENKHLAPIPSAISLEQRRSAATTCAAALQMEMPILVDDLDNHVATTYRAWPYRVYVLDRTGEIAYTSVSAGTMDRSAIVKSLEQLL